MRVLLTTDTIGGVWTFTKELTDQLLRRGHAIALVSFGRPPSDEQQAWCATTQAAHPDAFVYHPSSAALEWMQDNQSAFEEGSSVLMDVARSFCPDLLHASQYCFGRVPLAIPRLITAHSDVLSWADACRPEGLSSSPWLTRYRTMVQEGIDAADRVVAPTQWMSKALQRNFRVTCSATVIYNGRLLPVCANQPSRMLRAVSVGRVWDEAKNLSILTRIDSPIPIVVAGEERFAATGMSLGSAVKTLGPLAEPELLHLFRSSSIYLANSIYEPFGLAPLEAALCGCAVLARDIPSLREVWRHAAIYFSDPSSLEEQLRHLAQNPETLRVRQVAAQRRAQQFSTERMTDQYLAQYRDLLDAESGSREVPQELASHAA